jgi:AraC-like DNA-binding protein
MASGTSTYQEIYPADPILRKYIKLYYTHTAEAPDFYERIIYYPNYTTTLNIYANSKVEREDFSRTHTFDSQAGFTSLLVAKFDYSRAIIMQGPLNKLSIVFHPLGLNQFIDEPLGKYISDHFSYFDYFGRSFEKILPQLFTVEKLDEKREILDAFFLKQLKSFDELRLINAVEQIMQAEEPISVQELAGRLQISRKTLLRLFQKHLAYSPKEFMSVVRFRKALINYQSKVEKPNFTALAYESQFYDQSDLNHQFRERTGLTPNQLFTKLKTIQKELYWSVQRGVPKVQDNG